MPELPEVETIMQGMRPALEQRFLQKVQVNRPDLRRPFPAHLKETLTQRRIIKLYRRAKYILADLEGGWTLLIHLGMSGRIFIDPPGHPIEERRHEHVVMITDEHTRLALVDPRRFGMVDLFRTEEAAHYPPLASLGIEPLDDGALTPEHLKHALGKSLTPIKNALLDQKRIVGLGNIYVCEALFRASIHPARPATQLTNKERERLCMIIPEILHEAIKAGGSTLRDYVTTDGEKGTFQTMHQVYGREGEECIFCAQHHKKTALIMRITQSGRSTFFCPQHQRK
ncbi:bifunctional DNA-formamidopyrimidine glycosylase/DNA-(apurinic or apyrimidinic site) lyase [Saccharibacter sp. 17.LH.SD]|uniref:bifunctional DNA-formamidopyrimidine glycosylase/DNA-(apurinic or apyrimidinic site) lyase n=1 Tax=Saccharibacter sp. 17.LH.SD TaxID=2689393 RepID=UPI001368C704|nr:bifunctional DNA-formamidopyrimidine glycosylase/DNA-(apurinic or apyrimidinic site) lyase [Saccharibacter sp. 17.LH.SD]MXV44447.1 bifunctional DNA-formamidopyrimidine glycosylase/DNA-(apurinic or apyrimidinic site) lyase [Saccharibacter sp. 17.LH.SD]